MVALQPDAGGAGGAGDVVEDAHPLLDRGSLVALGEGIAGDQGIVDLPRSPPPPRGRSRGG